MKRVSNIQHRTSNIEVRRPCARWCHYSMFGVGCSMFDVLPLSAHAADPPAKGYDAFRLVQTRHIFDPNRQPPPRAETRRELTRTSRSNYLALTGTMVTES